MRLTEESVVKMQEVLAHLKNGTLGLNVRVFPYAVSYQSEYSRVHLGYAQ